MAFSLAFLGAYPCLAVGACRDHRSTELLSFLFDHMACMVYTALSVGDGGFLWGLWRGCGGLFASYRINGFIQENSESWGMTVPQLQRIHRGCSMLNS